MVMPQKVMARMPDMWKISALRYDMYAITKTNRGSRMRAWFVNRVTNPVT